MTELEETLVYDAMIEIQKNSHIIASLVNRIGTDAEKVAYNNGMYAPCVKLQCLLGTEAMNRGEVRHERIKTECAKFMQERGK